MKGSSAGKELAACRVNPGRKLKVCRVCGTARECSECQMREYKRKWAEEHKATTVERKRATRASSSPEPQP
jgi:hypothetical protein